MRQWFQKNKILIIIIALGILLRLLFFFLSNGISWDSDRYLEQAHNSLHGYFGQTYGEFGVDGVYILPPLYPLIVGLFSLVFHPILFAGRLVSLISAILLLLMVYKLGILMFDKKVGLIAAFLTSIYIPFVVHAGDVVIEPVITLFLTGTIYLIFSYTSDHSRIKLLSIILLSVILVLLRPPFLVIIFLTIIFFFIQKKISVISTLLTVIIPFMILILYYAYAYQQFGKKIYYYPKTVLTESLYLEGIFPDAYKLNNQHSTLLFIDNNFSLGFILYKMPFAFSLMAAKSFSAGISYFLYGNLFLFILSLFVFLTLISDIIIEKRLTSRFPYFIIFVPVISLIVVYSLFLTQKNFMGRVAEPLTPLYFILASAGVKLVIPNASKIKKILNKQFFVLIFAILPAFFITDIFPSILNLTIMEGKNIVLRKTFIGTALNKLELPKNGAVITSHIDGREIAYLKGRNILYLPNVNDEYSLFRYAEINNACCIITENKLPFAREYIMLSQTTKPFPGSAYALYLYRFSINKL